MKVYCPYCKKEESYRIEKRKISEFKGSKIDTYENVGVCENCGNDLYISKLEEENNRRIYKTYKEKENIINPEDIVNFREKYDLSQRELTAILDLGKMTINRYERGEVPTKAKSDYIKVFIDNEAEFKKKVKEAYDKNNINEKTYNKVISKTENSKIEEFDFQDLYRRYLNQELKRTPDIYNGYQEFDLNKTENIISYIASKVKNLTITSLNKYLWYIDMYSFKNRSVSITGLTYEHEQYGPAIIEKKYDEISILDDKYKREDIESNYGTTTKIVSNENYDLSIFSDEELKIINEVINKFKNKKVNQISETSHKEAGWKETERFEKISFEYAMKMKE